MRWISVNDRLPNMGRPIKNPNKKFLVRDEDGKVYTCTKSILWLDGWRRVDNVTHWKDIDLQK